MLSQQLKGLLTVFPDQTDLPTAEMVMAGVDVLQQANYTGELSHEETVILIWHCMMDELSGRSIRLPFSAGEALL